MQPTITADDGCSMSYSDARAAWESGEFSDWVETHGGWPIGVDGAAVAADECEDALSDDQWD